MRKLGRSKRKTWMEQLQLLNKSPYILLRRHSVSCREKNLSQSSQSSNQNVIPAEEENLESQHRGNSEKERPANNLQDIPQRSDTQISNAVAETALIGVLDISKTCQRKFQEHNLSSRELSSETIPESNATSSKNTISKSKIYPKTKVDNLIDRNQDVSSSEKRIDLDLIEHVDTSLYQTSITKDVNQTKINLESQNAQTVSFIEINSKPIIKRKISSESLDRNALMKIQKKNKMNMLSDKIVTDNNIEVLSDNKLEKNTKKESRVTKYMIRKQENFKFKLLKQKKEQHKKEMNQKTKNVREKIHKCFKGFSYTDINENKEKFNVLLNYLNLRRKPDGPVHNITTEGKIEDIFERNKKLTHNTSVNDNLRKDIDSVIPTKIKSNNLHDFTVSIDKHVIYNTTSNEKTEDTTRKQRIASIEKHSIMHDAVSNKEDATLLCKRDTLTNYNNSQENIKNPVSVIVKFDNSNNSTAYVEHNCLKQNVSTHEEIENGASLHKSDILANNLQENMKRAISVIVKSNSSNDSTAPEKNYAMHDITDKISEMSRRGSTSNSSKNNTSLGENENVSVNTENYDITCDFSPTTKDNINDSQQQQRNIQNYPILSETDKRNAIESNQRGRNECTQSANAITENSPESSKLACDISNLRKQVQEALTDDKQKKNKEKQNSQNNTTSEEVINVTGDNQGKENNCISFIEQKKTQLEMLIEAKLIRQNNSGTVAYDTSNIGEQLSQPSSDATHSKVQVQSTKELNCCNDAKSAKPNASASSRSAYSVFCQSASFHSVLPQSAVPQSALPQTTPQSVPLQLASLQSALPQTTPQSVPLQLASLQSALPQTTPQSVPLQLAFPQSALLQTVAPQSVPLQLTSLQSALPQTTPQSVPLQLAFPQSALLQTVAPQSVPFQLTSLLQQPPLHNITVKQVPSEANASVNLNTANIEHLPYIEQILIRRICNNITQCRDVQNKISFVRLQMQASAKYLVKLLRIHIELNEALQELKVRLRMNDVQCTLAYVNQYKILSRPITVIEINNYIEFIQRYMFYGTQILDKNNVKFDVLQCQNTSGSVPNASMPNVNAQPFSKKKKRVSNHDRSRQSLLHPVSMIPNVDSVNQQQLFDNSANFVQVSHLIQSKPNIRQQYMSYVPSTAHIYMPHANQQQFSENTSYPVQSQYMPSANMSTVGIQQAYVNINKVSSSNTNMGLYNTINQGDAHLSPATNNKETEILELQNKHPGQNKLSSMNSQQDSQHQKTLIAYNVSQNTSDIVSNNSSLQKTSNVQTHSVQNIRPHQNAQPQLRRSQRLMQLQKVLNKEAENIWPHQNVRPQLRRSQRLMQLQKVPNKEAEILELQNKHPGQNKLSSMNSQQDSQHQKILIAYNVSQNTSDTVSNNCTSQKTNNLQNTLCKISSQNLDLPQSAPLLLQRKEALGYNFNLEVLTVRQKILLYEQIKSYFLILDQIKYSLNEQECRQILHERSMLLFLFRCLHDYLKDLPETIKRCDEKDLQENTSQNKSITEEKTMQISVDELTKIQSSRNENSSTSNRNLEKQSSEQAINLSISKNSKPTVVSSNLEVRKEKSLFTESNANETSNVATLNNNGRNDATLSPYSTEDQNKEVSNPSNEIPSENLQDGMCDDVNENIEMLTVTEIQSDLLNTSHDSIPASSNSIRPSISPITKSTEISEVFIIHEELADTISECLNVRQEDSTNERSNNFIEETSESSGKWWLDKNREESQRQEQCGKISSKEYNLKILQNSARPFDTITCDSAKVPLSLLKKIVEGADILKNFVIKAQNTEFNKELLEAKNIISEKISLKFEDEWNMGENTIQPIDIKKNKDTKEEDNEQLLIEEETSCEEMSLKFNISENSSSIEENTVEYILELPEGPEEEKMEIDTHNDIKTIHEQLKHVSEDKYYEKLQPSSCNSIQKDNPIDINVEIFAKNDILNNVECIYMESDSEDMIKPNILNVRSISPTLFEKMENTDTFPQSDLKSLNENDEKLLDYINVNQEISDDVDDMPCLRCRRKSTIYCGACLEAHYCSKRCSSLHWKSDHYKKCKGDTILCVNIV